MNTEAVNSDIARRPAPHPNLVIEDCLFWFVWTKTGHLPRFAHHTHADAEAEADRLAALHRGRKFIVLRAYRKSHVPVPAPHGEPSITSDNRSAP